jgi:hypothetical protein
MTPVDLASRLPARRIAAGEVAMRGEDGAEMTAKGVFLEAVAKTL